MDKVIGSPQEAVVDIATGSSVAVAGFGIGHRFPSSLLIALRDSGVGELCIVCNSLGTSDQLKAHLLVENQQVSKLIAAFSARPKMRSLAEEQIAAGKLEVELVPQGTLVERMRAGGAGLAGIYTPTGVGTAIAEGKEIRYFDDKPYVFERALRVDCALLRGHRADRIGNVQFRGGSQNFNPSFAKAARVAIVEVDEIVDVGQIPPDDVDLPGIFVTRVVKSTIRAEADPNSGTRRRSGESRRSYLGKEALSRTEVARRAAALLPEGSYVNLGTGIPTLVSNHLAGRQVMLHAENGVLGYGALVTGDDADLDVYNASGQFVSLAPGAAFFDSVTSFEMVRGGKLSAVVLGGYQVDEEANLANWSTSGIAAGGIGGAMDLATGECTQIVLMEHCDSNGQPKLVKRCTYPLTAVGTVNLVVTDLACIRRHESGFVLEEVARGFTADEVLGLTEMKLRTAEKVGVMQDAL